MRCGAAVEKLGLRKSIGVILGEPVVDFADHFQGGCLRQGVMAENAGKAYADDLVGLDPEDIRLFSRGLSLSSHGLKRKSPPLLIQLSTSVTKIYSLACLAGDTSTNSLPVLIP